MSSSPIYSQAVELARWVAEGQLSAEEALEAHLSRIADLDGRINSVVVLDRQRALGDARRIDAMRRAGEALGPLAGVPVTVKEAFEVAGLPTTAGVEARRAAVAAADAPAVARLRRAGAVILGKTNVPVNLADLQADNPLYGRTANPWDLSLTCGGSSGGSAAAVAAGMSLLDLGSDLSGSIRVPAAWCGVFGLRPTPGLISKLGHLPWPPESLVEPPHSAVGPLARSVADLELAYEVLVGAPGVHAEAQAAEVARGGPVVGRPRIGLWTKGACEDLDPQVKGRLLGLAKELESQGATVEPFEMPGPEEALELGWRLVRAEICGGLDPSKWEAQGRPGGYLAHWWQDRRLQEEAVADFCGATESFDALLCPAVPTKALPHDPTPSDRRQVEVGGRRHPFSYLSNWSVLTSLYKAPSVVVPLAPEGAGAPVGVALVGAPFKDRQLLELAKWVEQVTGGFRRPPGW